MLTLSEVGLGERCAGSGLGQGHQETRRALGGGWGRGHRLSGSHTWHPWVLEVDCLCRVSVASWVTGLFTRDGWSRASRTVRRHSLTQPAVPPPPPPPRGRSLGLGPCLGNVGASAAGAVCSARGAGRGGSEDHGLRTARPSGAQFAASRPSGQHVATEVEATCAFCSDSPPSRSRLPRGGPGPVVLASVSPERMRPCAEPSRRSLSSASAPTPNAAASALGWRAPPLASRRAAWASRPLARDGLG